MLIDVAIGNDEAEVKTDRGTNDAASSKHDEAKEADAGADDRAVTEPVGAVYDFIDGAAASPHERTEGQAVDTPLIQAGR